MAAADTAKLLASLDLQDAMSPKLKTAMGNVSAAEGRVGSLSGGLAKLGSTLRGGVGGALTTFTGRIRQFGLGLAAAAGIGGLLSFTGALERSFGKAQEWGLQIEKLQGITRNSAEQLSGLLAVTEKYGLSNERLAQIAGFTEKALGALALTNQKGAATVAAWNKHHKVAITLLEKEGLLYPNAIKFQKLYGFSILDASGHVKSFNRLLLEFSDFWNKKGIPASTKAAAAAKLFGRGYADLVPILNLGKKGIQDAEEEARALGLTLTKDNVTALAKAREATRQWGDALSGLELQIGLNLLPTITDLAKAATAFVSSHRTDIVSFFHNAVQAAKNVAGTIGDLAGTIGTFWSTIPEGVRDLLVKGFVADRTVKFLFGFDPIKGIASGLEGAFSKAVGTGLASAGLGKLFVQPVFVTNPGFGGSLPGAAGAAGAAGAEGGGLALVGLGGIILASVAAGEIWLADQLRKILHPTTSGDLIQSYTPSEAADYHSGRKSVEDIMSDRAAITAGFAGANAREDRTNFELQAVKARLAAIHNAIKASIGKLDERLKHPLLPHSVVNHQLHAALRIAKSSESTEQKIKDLEAIDKDLRAGGHKTAHYVEDLIAVEKAKKTKFTANFRTTVNVNGHTVYRIASTNTSVPILASRAGTDL